MSEDKKINEEIEISDDKKKNEDVKKESLIPMNKRSKLSQKEFHASKRGSWGSTNPVTRTPPNPKAYNRRKTGR